MMKTLRYLCLKQEETMIYSDQWLVQGERRLKSDTFVRSQSTSVFDLSAAFNKEGWWKSAQLRGPVGRVNGCLNVCIGHWVMDFLMVE